MNLPSVLAFLVIGATPLFWVAAGILWRRTRKRPDIRLLRLSAEAATALAVYVTIIALVFLNNGMEVPILDPFATMIVTRSALLVLLGGPVIRWLWVTRGLR